MEATLVYPHQLFEKHPAIKKGRIIFLIEDELFFNQYPFHKKKLLFHRVSMKKYASFLQKADFNVVYVESGSPKGIEAYISEHIISEIHICEVDDDWLSRKIRLLCEKLTVKLIIHQTPSFMTPLSWSKEYYSRHKTYFQTKFYIEQRKRLHILVDDNGEPIGGSWTYDSENRKKLPKVIHLPEDPKPLHDAYIEEGKTYVETKFGSNPGLLEKFIFPTSHADAKVFLEEFLSLKLHSFGSYQDVLTVKSNFVYHSILSPLMNVGLLTPSQVIANVIEYAEGEKVALNSLEGFVRQIIGWREFFRAVYRLESRKQRTTNYFSFVRKIPKSFWDGTTGVFPIDTVIKKVLATAYAHHIERLMVLGNFMLLCEFDPDEVYAWFMIFFIDSYDWVMVPNVYGMSQHADGGLITTKPYISSSNYIKKMSDYGESKEGDRDWDDLWDALYWRFISKHQERFASNPRMSMMINQLSKMDLNKRTKHSKRAEAFLKSLEQ